MEIADADIAKVATDAVANLFGGPNGKKNVLIYSFSY